MNAEMVWTRFWIGSIIFSAYEMKTDSVPSIMTPSIVIFPPFHRTSASAMALINVISELNRAALCVVFTEIRFIFSVSSSKSFCMRRSMPMVLMVLAPAIPSLKFPVIAELISRMRRFS